MELLTKCQCGNPILSDAKIEDGIIIVEVELCPKCVARAIQSSEQDEWMRNKYLKEGGVSDYEVRKGRNNA